VNEVLVFLCNNCIPVGTNLDALPGRNDIHVEVKILPCSGKISVQYLFHAIEGGKKGICLIACPQGECTLFQGNYRAHIRIENVKQLLTEIGIPQETVGMIYFSKQSPCTELYKAIDDFVDRIERAVQPAAELRV
jgi:coenzyme F420-reducing hydrogenase delta subunit